ncbi:MAG TPA: beta-N-acetylhexosaminidase [Bacteroidetes bacterium]|nr:beta-N-acetylhexosaminidase [Bacteroidota bacterium]
MRRFIALIVIAFANVSAFAAAPVFNAKNLTLTWEVVDNNYKNKQQSLTALIITNNGTETLPAGGWKIYFNSSRNFIADAVSGNAKILPVNGDLYSITPNQNFNAIKPGESTRIEYICENIVVNYTDAIEGPYFVWDSSPDKGYLPGNFIIKPLDPKYPGLVTPEVIYNQNKTIIDIPAEKLPKIVPLPLSYQETQGIFTLAAGVKLIAADARFTPELKKLDAWLLNTFGVPPATGNANTITLGYKVGFGKEGYELSVKPTTIQINASTEAGMFYGIQSLKNLCPSTIYSDRQKSVTIPCVEVKDSPRFGYRAVMLDVARNFQSKKEVLRLLDLMGAYKLNILHMHLTDDEGWRIQIPSLPELTSVASKRGHTLDSKNFLPASHGSGPYFSNPAGTGFYSVADYIEILKYANERHITVMPEIETPGHARGAIKAMQARYSRLMAAGKKAEAAKYLLYDANDQSAYRSVQYWNDNVIDVSLPSTYTFVERVVDDLVAMYKQAGAPLPVIHFGGDEVPAHVWEKSPAYEALKKNHPEIKNTGDLWYYFYGRVNSILKKKNITLAGWEEMALRKTTLDGHPTYLPNPQFVNEGMQVDVWNNVLGDGQEDLAYKLANAGYKTVLTCVTNLYFDMATYKSWDEPGYYWGAFLGIDKFFSFIPFDYFKNTDVDKNGKPIDRRIFVGKQRLTDYGKENIIGLQGALWAETVKTPQQMEYMIFPKLIALGERAWAKDPAWTNELDSAKAKQMYNDDWSRFVNVLGKRELPRLAYEGGGYAFRIPKPGVILKDGKYYANVQYPGMVIRYTTNGAEPTADSPQYTGPVDATGTVKFRVFDAKGRGGNVAEGNGNDKPAI